MTQILAAGTPATPSPRRCRALLRVWTQGAQQGQSLTELALVMPILLIVILIAANFGLALRTSTDLAQIDQQAAQHLLHHPADATGAALAAYLNGTVSLSLQASDFSFTYQAAGNDEKGSGTPTTQQVSVKLTHGFPFIVPLVGLLRVGPFSGNSLTMGTVATSIAATPAPGTPTLSPGITAGCTEGTIYAGSTYTATWTRPVEADGSAVPVALPLIYRLYATWPGFPTYRIYTSAPTTAASVCYVDHDSTVGTVYQVDAVEPNNLASPLSGSVTAS